jgi:hypothetical protein
MRCDESCTKLRTGSGRGYAGISSFICKICMPWRVVRMDNWRQYIPIGIEKDNGAISSIISCQESSRSRGIAHSLLPGLTGMEPL